MSEDKLIWEDRITFDIAHFADTAKKQGIRDEDILKAFIVHCTQNIAVQCNKHGLEGRKLVGLKEQANGDIRVVILELSGPAPGNGVFPGLAGSIN